MLRTRSSLGTYRTWRLSRSARRSGTLVRSPLALAQPIGAVLLDGAIEGLAGLGLDADDDAFAAREDFVCDQVVVARAGVATQPGKHCKRCLSWRSMTAFRSW